MRTSTRRTLAASVIAALVLVAPSGSVSRAAAGPPSPNPGGEARSGPTGRGLTGPNLALPAASPVLGRTARILLVGGAAGFLSWQTENPDRAAVLLENGAFEGPVDVGDAYANGLVLGSVAAGGWAVGRFVHAPRLEAFGADLTRSLLVTSAAVWSLKVGLNRTRPNGAGYSFPSGHTAVAFCAAPVFQKHFGWKVGLPAYALAVGAGLGRMEDRKHFLSDVVVGAALGLAVGDAVIRPGFADGLMDRIAVDRSGVGLRLRF